MGLKFGINGQENNIILDTGSPITMLTKTSFATLRLCPSTKFVNKLHNVNRHEVKVGAKKLVTVRNVDTIEQLPIMIPSREDFKLARSKMV